jgi:16S rRNA (cytidine1402-2'-O)-methyltransferase
VALCNELTKLYESTWRGSLDAAIAYLEETAPRGEYVIVVGGAETHTGDRRAEGERA